MKHEIKSRHMQEKGFLKVETGVIEVHGSGKEPFTRERLLREDAAAVLVHDISDDTIILTRQFRFAVSDRVAEYLFEIPAGKVEPGEEAIACAARETEEECGYRVEEKNLELIASFFASPGYTTEKYFIYYTTVKETNRISEGGGLEGENEYITTIKMPRNEFLRLFENLEIEDAKTWAAASWLARREGK